MIFYKPANYPKYNNIYFYTQITGGVFETFLFIKIIQDP